MKPNYKKLYWKWNLQPETIQRIEPVNVNDDAEESSRNSSLDHSGQRKSHHLTLANENLQGVIPQFYFQNGRPASTELKFLFISRMNPFFNHTVVGMLMFDEKLKSITKELCQLPSFFSYALFRKIDTKGTGVMTRDAFINYWVAGNMMMMDTETKIYKILKQPDCEYLSQDDFKPILQRLLETHPGLQFISALPKTQERYAQTVLYRIFYYNNRSGNGRLTLRELKRGNLIDAMQHVDEEEDINEVLRYFSYEQFYVILRKFEKLDRNCDFLIDETDLISYDGQALTSRIVARIFSQAPRKFTCEVQRRMNYEDFVYFLLSEGDKSSEPGIEYWFKCLDLDGNGKLTPDELRFFYEEQKARMVVGPMSFEDVLCQIIDMIAPERQDCITLRDLKLSKLSGNVFNLLFNLKRFYVSGSMEDIRLRFRDPELTEWDLFAGKELATIDKDEEVGSGSEDE